MTVPTTTNKVIATGNGVATVFPFAFGTLPSGDLVVTLIDLDGIEYPQVENTDYTVQGEGDEDGGSVTFIIAPPTDQWTVLIQRILPETQPTDLKNQGSFFPRTIERMLDRVTMLIQQLSERIGSALTLPAWVTGVSTELPAPESNKLIGWNETPDGLRNFAISELATTLAFSNFIADQFTATPGQVNFTLSADPGAIGNLDIIIDGVGQRAGVDYTYAGGAMVTFTTPMVGGEEVQIRYGTALPTGITDSLAVLFQQHGTGAVVRTSQDKMRDFVSVKDFGAVGDGVADDLHAFQKAVAILGASGGTISVPVGTFKFSAPLVIEKRNVEIVGEGADSAARGGTQIRAYGTDAIVIGSDNGHSWNAGDYDGFQNITLRKMNIVQMVLDTQLEMGPGYMYGAGTKGVADWRGGDLRLDEVKISGFEYNAFCVQSDINYWGKVTSTNSKYGIYAGPRSDQFHIEYLYSFYCDRALTLDLVDGFTVGYLNIVACGGANVDPVEIRRGAGTVFIGDCWVESFGLPMRSLVGAGCVDGYGGETRKVNVVDVRNVTFYGPNTGNILGSVISLGRAKVTLGNFNAFRGSGPSNIVNYVLVPSDQSWSGAEAFITIRGLDYGLTSFAKFLKNDGTGSPTLLVETSSGAGPYICTTAIATGLIIREFNATKNYLTQISSADSIDAIEIRRNDMDAGTRQQRRLFLRRSFQSGGAAPSTGAWQQGDRVFNSVPVAGGVDGWICVADGSPGTWVPFGCIQTANAYTVTNGSTDRALDVTADTTAQVAAVLGTLITDLKASGVLK